MKYKDMTLQEIRYCYLTAKNVLEKDLLLLYGTYRKLDEMTVDQLRQEWKKESNPEKKKLIERIGKAKTIK